MQAMPQSGEASPVIKNLLSFWILGLCNNFAYVIMLSAAKDILSTEEGKGSSNSTTKNDLCQPEIKDRECSPISTGSVLLADILPALFVKMLAPFVMSRVPFGIRHLIVVLLQTLSFLVVANSNNIIVGLTGVVLASIGSGLGEVTYLSLTSHFSNQVVASWSSGTGAAGVFGAFAYASLTDPHMLSLSPRHALLFMLIIPLLFLLTYYCLLVLPLSIHRVIVVSPSTYIVPAPALYRRLPDYEHSSDDDDAEEIENETEPLRRPRPTFTEKLVLAKPLLKFMIPLSVVYFAEYFINQGLVELLVFNCVQGFNLGRSSQYRWYQVLYQIGVFISRSSSECLSLPTALLPFLAVLQLFNAAFFFWDAISWFIPHISIVFGIILYEGLLGGASYVNTFNAIHKTVHVKHREFSMGFASMADSFGIVTAGFLAIPAHNYICGLPL